MSPLWRTIKSIVFWSYGRTTWQYDILCALILAFIFLTPKSWFEQGEPGNQKLHQNHDITAERLFIRAENLRPNPDAQEIEQGARKITGRSGAQVRGWQALRSADGQIVAYEVDIQ